MDNFSNVVLFLWGFTFVYLLLPIVGLSIFVFNHGYIVYNRNTQKMKKEITLGELLATALILMGSFITGYVNIKTQLSTQEVRIEQLEGSYSNIRQDLKDIKQQLEKQSDNQTQILIQLQDKQNRK